MMNNYIFYKSVTSWLHTKYFHSNSNSPLKLQKYRLSGSSWRILIVWEQTEIWASSGVTWNFSQLVFTSCAIRSFFPVRGAITLKKKIVLWSWSCISAQNDVMVIESDLVAVCITELAKLISEISVIYYHLLYNKKLQQFFTWMHEVIAVKKDVIFNIIPDRNEAFWYRGIENSTLRIWWMTFE